MKYLLLFLLAFNYSLLAFSQNLVPNPSFEELIECPDANCDVNDYVIDWYSCNGTPNYFNTCNSNNCSVPLNAHGYQALSKGFGYCGIYTSYAYVGAISAYFKEYIGCKLNTSLTIGKKYYISYQVSLSNNSKCATNNIGVLFSTVNYKENNIYDNIWDELSPNYAHVNYDEIIIDTIAWTSIISSFISDSTYEYIIIGNFFDKNHTDSILYNGNICYSYYYIDNICVSKDSLTCNQSVNIINVEVNENINFHQTQNTIYFEFNEFNYISYNIYNELGIKIKSNENVFNKSIEINISDFKKGLYFIKIQNNDKIMTKKFIKL